MSQSSFENNRDVLQPFLRFAGADVSHLLNSSHLRPTGGLQKGHGIKTFTEPINCLEITYHPSGEFLHAISEEPRCNWQGTIPWWKDESLIVGRLSLRVCKVCIRNSTTGQENVLEVPGEENIAQIMDRYLEHNALGDDYVWKCARTVADEIVLEELDFSLTLAQNGVIGSVLADENLSISSIAFLPVIHLHIANDLSVL